MTFQSNGIFIQPNLQGDPISGTWRKIAAGRYFAEYSASNWAGSVYQTMSIQINGDSLTIHSTMVVCYTGGDCETIVRDYTGSRLEKKSYELELPALSDI